MVRFAADGFAADHRPGRESSRLSPSIRPPSSFAPRSEASYAAGGGEVIKLPPDEQATFIKTLSSVGADVSKAESAACGGL